MTLICSNWAHVRASFSFAATRHKEALLVPRSHSGACSEAPRVIYLHVSCIGYVYVCMYLCIMFPLLTYVSRIEYVHVSIVYVHTLLGSPRKSPCSEAPCFQRSGRGFTRRRSDPTTTTNTTTAITTDAPDAMCSEAPCYRHDVL